MNLERLRLRQEHQAKFDCRTAEIQADMMVKKFRHEAKLKSMAEQEAIDQAQAAQRKADGIKAAREWADSCRREHERVVKKAERERDARNRQLKKEAIEMQ